jgi:hypothetical protein
VFSFCNTCKLLVVHLFCVRQLHEGRTITIYLPRVSTQNDLALSNDTVLFSGCPVRISTDYPDVHCDVLLECCRSPVGSLFTNNWTFGAVVIRASLNIPQISNNDSHSDEGRELYLKNVNNQFVQRTETARVRARVSRLINLSEGLTKRVLSCVVMCPLQSVQTWEVHTAGFRNTSVG